jgi:nucleoporin NUP159
MLISFPRQYPTFRLLNKTTRVYLSEPFKLDNLITYRPFAVANTKGWFAAVRKIGDAQGEKYTPEEHQSLTVFNVDIIFSTLEELRTAVKNASEDDKGFFFPQRDLSLDLGLPTMLAFGHNDARLVVGVDNGSIYVYNTANLFSPGSDFVKPLRTFDPQVAALRQIAANPSTEPDFIDTIAVVRSDGSVQLMNTMLEPLGGWSSGDSNVGSVAGEHFTTYFLFLLSLKRRTSVLVS